VLALECRTLPSTLTVLNNQDSGPGSLRDTIAAAASGDTINFDAGLAGQTITLTSGQLLLNKSLEIDGPGADQLTVSGNHASRVFQVASGVTDSISGLTISNGLIKLDTGAWGGGILNQGTLTLTSATVSDNVSDTQSGDTDWGGGIYNNGTLTIQNSTITRNTAVGYAVGAKTGIGGGIYNVPTTFHCGPYLCAQGGILTVLNSTVSANNANDGGGIFNFYVVVTGGGPGMVTMQNSTVSGNAAIADGGGILNRGALTVSTSSLANNTTSGNGGGISNWATATVSNSTVSGNQAALDGGGITNNGHHPLNVSNTILAGNSASRGASDLSGSLDSSSYNLIGGNPVLGPLQDNGGPTQTMALLPGSPALNAGDFAQLGVADQRGVVRSGGVNIGAYQASATAFMVSAPDTAQAGMPFDVAVTVVDPFGQIAYGYTGTVTFSTNDPDPDVMLPAAYTFSAADQGSVTFSGGVTLITPGDQTITATDTADNTVTGSATVRVTSGDPGSAWFVHSHGWTAADRFFAEVIDQAPGGPGWLRRDELSH
jgi:hypothetical protein